MAGDDAADAAAPQAQAAATSVKPVKVPVHLKTKFAEFVTTTFDNNTAVFTWTCTVDGCKHVGTTKVKDNLAGNIGSHFKNLHPEHQAVRHLDMKKEPGTARIPVKLEDGFAGAAAGQQPSGIERYFSTAQASKSSLKEWKRDIKAKNKAHELDMFLAKAVATGFISMRFIENRYLRKALEYERPLYTSPSRGYITKLIKTLECNLRADIIKSLHELSTKFAITSDIWTSISNEGLVNLTISYIVEDSDRLRLKMQQLDAIVMPKTHTAKDIAPKVLEMLTKHELVIEDISCLTCDNASSMKNAVDELGVNLGNCGSHVSNLAIGDILKLEAIAQFMKVAQKIARLFRKSTKATAFLKEEQERLFMEEHKEKIERMKEEAKGGKVVDKPLVCRKRQVQNFCVTRWGSAANMLSSLILLQTAIQVCNMAALYTIHVHVCNACSLLMYTTC